MTGRLLIGIVAASAALAAFEPPASDPSSPAPIRMNAVAVDAKGVLVPGLNAGDFELAVDGSTQPIDSVRFVDAGVDRSSTDTPQPIFSRADEEAAAAEDGSRLFAVFLDEYHVTDGPGVGRVREVMTRFVEQTLKPRDLLVVVKPLDSILALQLTRDRASALATIAAFAGRRGQYDARNEFESSLIAGTPARIEAVRAQIATSALNALANHLGMLSGARKTIVFVSEGFVFAPRSRGNEALPSIDTAIRTANRGNVSIYPFDPTSGDPDSRERGMLGALAAQTEGEAIASVDPDGALARVAAAGRAYYIISFRPASLAADGRFHPVVLSVRKPGIAVTARKGYWAPSPDDVLRARLLARGREPKAPPEPPRRISPLIRPWFGIARGASGKTEVNFVWEPASRVPGDRTRLAQPAKLTLQAFAADGAQIFEGVVKASGSGPGAPDVSGDLMRATFEANPGRLRLRMAIEDAAARPLDTDVRDLVVDPLTAPVALGTPEVFRARNARDLRAFASDASAVPVATRVFSRAERLLIRVPAYAPDGAPTVTARLASKAGSMRDIDVMPGPSAERFQIDLPLAGLASGEYVITLRVASGASEARSDVAFRVTP